VCGATGDERFEVLLFKLYDADEELSHEIGDEEDSSIPYKELLLPSRSLDKLWEKYARVCSQRCAARTARSGQS
jgi:hypothetical protein